MQSIEEAKVALKTAWPLIKSECLSVLGSELHYQAMIYHALRTDGRVPANQIGMNVKMWIDNPVSELFKRLSDRKHENYRRGFEPNVINLSCSPAQGKPPEAASRHGRRAMTRPLPLNQAV